MDERWPKQAILTELKVLNDEMEHYVTQLNQTLAGFYSIKGRIAYLIQELSKKENKHGNADRSPTKGDHTEST